MNLLLFPKERLSAHNQLQVEGTQLTHLREVLHAETGSSIRVGEINGLMGDAHVVELSSASATLQVSLSDPPPPKPPLTLVLALPRPKMLRRLLRTVAELGIAQCHLINSYRVEKSYWQTPALEPATVEGYFLQGLEQSRDTVLPILHCHRRFKPFVEDTLPGLVNGARALVAHPGDYPPCPAPLSEQKTLLTIGPEGGFIPYEIEKLQAAGLATISLGPRILRVENAVSTLIARLTPG